MELLADRGSMDSRKIVILSTLLEDPDFSRASVCPSEKWRLEKVHKCDLLERGDMAIGGTRIRCLNKLSPHLVETLIN